MNHQSQRPDVAATIERVLKPIQQFTRGWMMADATTEYGERELGLDRVSRQFWLVGRAGVLGSCPAEVAAGALAFHAPDKVAAAWNSLPAGVTHSEVAQHYAGRCIEWGERVLPMFEPQRLGAIDSLGRRIIDAAPDALGPLFAGWRALPIPGSVFGRAALTTQVMREMRGAAHIAAVLSVGLSPLDAILASTNAPPRTGPEYAIRMGFEPPFRDPGEVMQARLEAESVTSRILEPFFSVLSPDEMATFGEVVETTRNAIDM